jgi:hypothetical protein
VRVIAEIDKCAAPGHVQDLYAATHAQNRDIGTQGRVDWCQLEIVTLPINKFRCPGITIVQIRIHVSASGQQERIDLIQNGLRIVLGRIEFERSGSGANECDLIVLCGNS